MPPPQNELLAARTGRNLAALGIKPTPSDGSGAPPPDNSEVRKIAEDALGALKYSFAAVAANPQAAVRPDSVELAFKDAIEQLPQATKKMYKATATELVNASDTVKRTIFGRAAERDADEHIGAAGGFDRYEHGLTPLVIDRKLLGVRTPTISVPRGTLRATPEGLLIPGAALPTNFENFDDDFESAEENAATSSVFSDELLSEIWGQSFLGDPFEGASVEDDFEEFAVTDKMGFWITRVKCVDETNPEWWGHDEIGLAGVSVDEDGDTKKIGEKYIGGGFDDGDSKSYANWKYHWFSMREGNVWPKTYSVTLLLAEKDHGGLSNVLDEVWKRVRDKVKQMIASAVAGALTGYLGPVIAAAIGKAVAWVVDKLVGWIINAFKDDIFPPFTARVTTPSMSARWYYPNGTWGNPSSGIRTGHFYGFGGHYYVQYFWKFYL